MGPPGHRPTNPLGVDIEYCAKERPFSDLARRFFSDPEYQQFLQAGASPALFYRYWTLKEAYLKAIGTGLSFASSHFAIQDIEQVTPRLAWSHWKDEINPKPTKSWHFECLKGPSEYAAALCYDRLDAVEPRDLRSFAYSRHS